MEDDRKAKYLLGEPDIFQDCINEQDYKDMFDFLEQMLEDLKD